MGLKHAVGEYVMYGRSGICKISEIKKEQFGLQDENTYYVLCTVYNGHSKIYVPTNSEKLLAQMRDLMSADDIKNAIGVVDGCTDEWIDNAHERSAKFEEILAAGDRTDILRILRQLSLRKTEVESQKLKFYAADEKVLLAAEKIITEEFAFVLGIDKEEVIPYIISQTEQANKSAI